MAKDFAELPSTFLKVCKKVTKTATTSIGALARKVIAAKKGGPVNPKLLSRSDDVIDELLKLSEFATLADDSPFIYLIKTRVNYLVETKGLRTSHLDEFLAHEIAVHGVSSAWRRAVQPVSPAHSNWTDMDDDSMDNPATAAIKKAVLETPVDSRYQSHTLDDEMGGYAGIREPIASRQLDIGRTFGPTLLSNMDKGWFHTGPGSGVGPHGKIHTGFEDFEDRKPDRDLERSREEQGAREGQGAQVRQLARDRSVSRSPQGRPVAQEVQVAQVRQSRGKGRRGGKRTRRRKATTKKQKSKKNKRQSRRKVRRSSSRKAGRK